jgi:hypothetical protein
MAIAKKPSRTTTNTQPTDPEKAAEVFIAGAGGAPEPADARKTPVMIRFDRDLLQRVDAAAKRRGISRSAWVMFRVPIIGDADRGQDVCQSLSDDQRAPRQQMEPPTAAVMRQQLSLASRGRARVAARHTSRRPARRRTWRIGRP